MYVYLSTKFSETRSHIEIIFFYLNQVYSNLGNFLLLIFINRATVTTALTKIITLLSQSVVTFVEIYVLLIQVIEVIYKLYVPIHNK